MMGVMLAGLGIALWQLLRPPAGAPASPTAADLDRAASIVSAQPNADAGLALVGDKHLLFSASGNAFIMYGQPGRSWVSLFDPVGPRARMARARSGASSSSRPSTADEPRSIRCAPTRSLYLDAGLRALKLGEYAYVPLHDFSLKGSKRAGFRQA